MEDLPAAGAAAGRRLAVRVMYNHDFHRAGECPWRIPFQGCALVYGRAPR
jgi:hypothetical protein